MKTPRYLDISAAALVQPLRSHLDVIYAWMIWPKDEHREKRAKLMETARVELIKEIGHKLTFEAVLECMPIAAGAKPLSDIQREMGVRYRHGIRAGIYLDRALAGEKMESVVAEFASNDGVGISTFRKHWTEYRPVSHFWAASLAIAQLNQEAGADFSFPCQPSQISNLLMLSEGYRIAAETTTHVRQRSDEATIIPAGEAIAVDPTLNIKPHLLPKKVFSTPI